MAICWTRPMRIPKAANTSRISPGTISAFSRSAHHACWQSILSRMGSTSIIKPLQVFSILSSRHRISSFGNPSPRILVMGCRSRPTLSLVRPLPLIGCVSSQLQIDSHGNGRFDSGMRVVTEQLEILILKVSNIRHRGVEPQLWQGARGTRELQFGLFEVVRIEMQIPESVDKGAGLQPADLRHHHREQCVRGDVKGYAQE